MLAKTKTHLKWDTELKEYLKDITWCENCGATYLIQVAHRLKRRFIGWRTDLDRLEYFMAAKLCQICHQDLDEGHREDQHQYMYNVITEIILDRDSGIVRGCVQVHPQTEFRR